MSDPIVIATGIAVTIGAGEACRRVTRGIYRLAKRIERLDETPARLQRIEHIVTTQLTPDGGESLVDRVERIDDVSRAHYRRLIRTERRVTRLEENKGPTS